MGDKCIIVNDDGHGGFFNGAYSSVEGLEKPIELYRGTTLSVFEWGVCLGTKVNFLSENFELFGTGGQPDFAHGRRGDRSVAEILGEYARKGIDPLTVVAAKAHDVGLQIHASIRMNPDYSPDWIGAWLPNTYNDTFYFQHDPLRIRNRDGSRGGHLSYAYEEMQKRKLLLAEELLAHPVDGVNLDFLRHPPFVGYDPPLVERFIQEYGEDPRDLEEDDPRWIRCLCGPMTETIRAVRNIAGERAISVRVDHRYYLQQGLDVETWLNEGLVDILIVAEESLGGYTFDLRPFAEMVRGKGTLLFGEEAVCSGHDLTPEEDRALAEGEKIDVSRIKLSTQEYCQRAVEWYRQGANGVHIFNDQHNYEVLSVLGDPRRCRQIVQDAEP